MSTETTKDYQDAQKKIEEHRNMIRRGIEALKQFDKEMEDHVSYAVHSFPVTRDKNYLFKQLQPYIPDGLKKLVRTIDVAHQSVDTILSKQVDLIDITRYEIESGLEVSILGSTREYSKDFFQSKFSEVPLNRTYRKRMLAPENKLRKVPEDQLRVLSSRVDLTSGSLDTSIFDEVGVPL